MNCARARGFVSASASWSWVETWETRRALELTLSRIKWYSKARCFIREWKTGLAHRYVAPILSQYITGVVGNVTPSSVRREQTHRISEAVFATARYSASVDDRATPCCYLDDHAIGVVPMYSMYAFVETKSSTFAAQSASEKVWREREREASLQR